MAKPLSEAMDIDRAGVRSRGAGPEAVRFVEADISALADDLKACAASAVVPAGAHHHAWLTASFRHLRQKRPAQLLTAWRGHVLTGAMAIERSLFRWGLPRRAVLSWQSPLAFEGTPLVSSAAGMDAILSAHGGAALLLQSVPADGPFWTLLVERAGAMGLPVEVLHRWERAALRPAGSFAQWFEENFERKRRKEYRRIRARLGEQGKLESVALKPGEPVLPWLDDLAALEAKGWKGERGSALVQDDAVMASLREALPALASEKSLRFWKLALDGRPIAMMFAMVSGKAAWLGKIAFDEDHAKYSPGVLLILDATESLMGEGRIEAVDSCAIPGHPMIENIWRDRIALCDVIVGAPGSSPFLFGIIVAAERMRRRARQAAKAWFYSLTKRRQS